MKFLNRWLIEGTLTTHTPLRIGDGGVTTRPDCDFLQERKRGKKTGKPVEISSVAVDFESRAYIPATTIKGNLRSWARACGLDPALLDLFFGSENPRAGNAVAGKAQFWNAHAVKKDYQFAHEPPGWDAGRLTAVASGIAVMRRAHTVREKKLFHQEYVPPGVTFSFALGGNDYEEHDGRTRGNEGLLELLILLEGFNLVNAVTLGAEAGGLEKGWGRLRWDLATIKRLGGDDVKEWAAAGGSGGAGYDLLEGRDLPPAEIEELRRESGEMAGRRAARACPRHHVKLQVTLDCLENFIVNDPSRAKSGEAEQSSNDGVPQAGRKSDHVPLRDSHGMPILPRGSLKGAVRSQAERILRTMALARGITDEAVILKRVACHPDDPGNSCPPIAELCEARRLCLACQVFGAPGWGAPFKCSPFISSSAPESERQEFVAIDRFTGGVAGGKKFDAESFRRPTLSGELSLNLQRLEKIGTGRWVIGLLALTVRDLMEGDVRVGFGSAKGYGEINAAIGGLALAAWGAVPETFAQDLSEASLRGVSTSAAPGADGELGEYLQYALLELEEKIESVGR